MLNRSKNKKSHLLRYLVIVPCVTFLLTAFSFTQKKEELGRHVAEANDLIVGDISWHGNKVYSDEYLTDFLLFESGDPFSEEAINKSLYNPAFWKTGEMDISSLYMDNGYLFFSVNVEKEVGAKEVDIDFFLTEGEVATVDKIIVKGNDKVSTQDILDMVDIKKGDIFSRRKLNFSTGKIADSGLFVLEEIVPRPIPHQREGKSLVDIEFVVVEL